VDAERALPEPASLRYLKVEAKRRHSAGEFATLHEAQRAIAREHGQRSWAALRAAVAAAAGGEGHALTQLRWLIARFRGAGEPGWAAPGEEELRGHFTGEFLAAVPPEAIAAQVTRLRPALGEDLVVLGDLPFAAQARLAGLLITAATEHRPPYRLTGLRPQRLGERISDPRTAAPPFSVDGQVPGKVTALSAQTVARLGLAGLALAGASAPGPAWTAAAGWTSLERALPLRPGHAFPACQVTMAVTAVAILRLAAAGRLRLDEPANRYLTAVRLADDAVTVRELLAHTGGVRDPGELTAPAVPALAAVTGPAFDCTGRRGSFGYSHAGYAALGEVIAGITAVPYAEAVSRLVLAPLGLHQSWFPASPPDGRAPGPRGGAGGAAVTCYDVAPDGTFAPLPPVTFVFPAAAGLWSTAADLARFGLGWPSLLPRSLTAQALRPHATQPTGVPVGLGWAVNEAAGLAGIGGEGPGAGASLLFSLDGSHACAALTNRQIQVEPAAWQALALMRGAAA
jgi:CubicO group peptidase (beta-lactamase class C family)